MNLTTNKEILEEVKKLGKKFDKFQKQFLNLTKLLERLVLALEEEP